jgi:hypothetical protein
MRSRSTVLFVLLVGCLVGGTAIVAAPVAGATGDIRLENTLSQSAADDRIDVETRLSIPDSTTELEIVIPEETEVQELDGFERIDSRTYEWTGTTAEPSIRYEYEGTVRGTRGDREGVFFVVADEWALVRTPSIAFDWWTTDPDSEVVRENTVAGDGIASTHMAYLGPYTEHTGTAAGQEFRLVVPDAADLREDPDDILATLETAAERLTIGERDPGVFVVAAPTAEHTWASAGLQRGGGGDMWVRDAERLGTNRDTWIHEYVHTRQQYTQPEDGRDGTVEATRWTIEGMADYYAALLPYEAGDITYDEFRDRLEAGTAPEYDGVRLVDRETWGGTDADYDRGALVFAHLDRRLRAEADTTLDAVVADINADEGEFTQRRFLEAIETAGGSDIRADAERYTETTETPPIASQREHVAAFGGPDVRYSIDGVAISGPYRNAASETPRLVVGETLKANVTAENVGDDAGSFEAQFQVGGETVAAESGRLEPGETARLAFSHPFDSAGEFEISIGSETLSVTVEEPAGLAVRDIAVEPIDPAVGDTITVRATAVSAADRPAKGEVVFAVDGTNIATESARVNDGSVTLETTVSFDEAGTYAVSAGDQSIELPVREPTASTGTEAEDDAEALPSVIDEQPGFGPAIALVAISLFIAARRSPGRR